MSVHPNLKIEILKALKHVPSNLVQPEDALIAQVGQSFHPRPTDYELQQALSELQSRNLIVGITNTLEMERKWRITDAGKLELANIGL